MQQYKLIQEGDEWRLVGWVPAAYFRTFCAFVIWARKQQKADAPEPAEQLVMEFAT